MRTDPAPAIPENPDPALYPSTNLPGKHFMNPRMVAVAMLVALPMTLPQARTISIPVSSCILYPIPNPMNPKIVAAQTPYNFLTCETCKKYSELIHLTREENSSRDLASRKEAT